METTSAVDCNTEAASSSSIGSSAATVKVQVPAGSEAAPCGVC